MNVVMYTLVWWVTAGPGYYMVGGQVEPAPKSVCEANAAKLEARSNLSISVWATCLPDRPETN